MKSVLKYIWEAVGVLNAIALFGIAAVLAVQAASGMFRNCFEGYDFLGLGSFFPSSLVASVAFTTFLIAGIVALITRRWRTFAISLIGGVLCIVLVQIVPVLADELSNCPPVSPGGGIFAQSRPLQKCLGKTGGYEVDFVLPDIAKDEELERGIVVTRPPRTLLEEFSPRFIASVLLFSDQKSANAYAARIPNRAGNVKPEKIGKAWFIVRYGTRSLDPAEKEQGAPEFDWVQPTAGEREAVKNCIPAIPTWYV